jgi:preprotein translocase subunit SecF
MNFMKFRSLYFFLSALVIVPGLISLALYGLKPSIDFTGGSLLEVQVNNPAHPQPYSQTELQNAMKDKYEILSVQRSAASNYILRGKPINNEQKNQAIAQLQTQVPAATEVRFETVGPVLGKELIQKTLVAGILALIIIIGYVWRQFSDLKYGVAAVVAMVHDALVLIGSFSLLGHFLNVEVDVLFVTALLTILSFSIHDTIVVFDRIRENVRKYPKAAYIEIINASILETLGRSINNSITIIIMLLTLVVLGGQSIHWFSVALLIGAITGTYSSTFTAVPMLLVWGKILNSQQRKK